MFYTLCFFSVDSLDPPISDPATLDIIDKMLQLDPSKRITTSQAFVHDYFYGNPKSESIGQILSVLTEVKLNFVIYIM